MKVWVTFHPWCMAKVNLAYCFKNECNRRLAKADLLCQLLLTCYLHHSQTFNFVVFQLTSEEAIKEHIRECETRIQLGKHIFFNIITMRISVWHKLTLSQVTLHVTALDDSFVMISAVNTKSLSSVYPRVDNVNIQYMDLGASPDDSVKDPGTWGLW